MILKLLTSIVFSLFFVGCVYQNGYYPQKKTQDNLSYEEKFEKDLNEIFTSIDNSKESIRTVEEKQKRENKVTEKNGSIGSESFFRKSILERFKDE